jgi:transcriptional regulator with XRE-family HTH domain
MLNSCPTRLKLARPVVSFERAELHNFAMPTVEEKAAFSERLKFALQRSPEKVTGGTQLALHFNLRHHGDQPISPQTAHKWLTGRTIPTADKLRTLAEWLRVDLHWLHYGPPPSAAARVTPKPLPRDEKYPLTAETIELASKIESLSPHHRYLVQELIDQFYGDSAER